MASIKSQNLKLDICKRCLETKDTTLSLKLWCVTELSELVKLRMEESVKLNNEDRKKKLKQLVIDMKQCGAFNFIWGKQNTNIDIIKTSATIFKKLAEQQVLDDELMMKFWDLSTDKYYKPDVFRILTETKSLEERHLEFLVVQITKIKAGEIANMELSNLEL